MREVTVVFKVTVTFSFAIFVSHFCIGRDYISRYTNMNYDQNIPRKSMMYLMKNRKAKAFESAQAESYSSEFEMLFKEHWSLVYQLLCRLVGDPAEAEDLALETFFRLYQRHPSPQADFNLGGWLRKVATNLGLHSIRGFQRRERYELSAGKGALAELPENRPAEILAQEEERRLARQALASMKQQQAELLILRYSGFAYKEIAKALGLSPSSIGPLLLRAEREFEKQYRLLAQEEV
jgi:RNA polymerase sigma-70 factor (ECF subfamily)